MGEKWENYGKTFLTIIQLRNTKSNYKTDI